MSKYGIIYGMFERGNQMMRGVFAAFCLATSLAAFAAEPDIDVTGVGNRKFSASIRVGDAEFTKCLKKNLEISGLFVVSDSGSIKVEGAPGAIRATGLGKSVGSTMAFADARGARIAARALADEMCAAFGQQKGFAQDLVVFINRGKFSGKGDAVPGELCTAYPDGFDIRQLTSDGKMTIFPRWQVPGESILYISDRNGAPQIWEMNLKTGRRAVKWSFKGSPAGVAVSPDGSKVAAILSIHGNPELYILEGGRYTRLTNTPNASEGQPTWSPDGKKIAYVSNETRTPQIYVVDVATKAKRRLTSRGSQNVDPDWGRDGRIVYITKRGASQVAVMSPAEGDAGAEIITEPSNWEHPSWTRDMRHVIANRDGALFVVDTLKDGDKPRQMFHASGNWISPSIVK